MLGLLRLFTFCSLNQASLAQHYAELINVGVSLTIKNPSVKPRRDPGIQTSASSSYELHLFEEAQLELSDVDYDVELPRPSFTPFSKLQAQLGRVVDVLAAVVQVFFAFRVPRFAEYFKISAPVEGNSPRRSLKLFDGESTIYLTL